MLQLLNNNAPSKTAVYRWFTQSKSGDMSLEDDGTWAIKNQEPKDQRMNILHVELSMSKLSAKKYRIY